MSYEVWAGNTAWRESAKEPRILGFEWWSLAPFLAVPLDSWDLRFAYVGILTVAISKLMVYLGYDAPSFFRFVRSRVTGPKKRSISASRDRRMRY